MNIYLSLEIKKRELQSKLLLAFESAFRGHDIYLGRVMPLLRKGVFKPGLIHLKSITPSNLRLSEMTDLKKKGFLFTSLDEEYGYIDNNSNYVKSRYSKKTLELVDKAFVCGEFDYRNLMKKFSEYKNKIVKTGNPRFDFWRNDFKNFFKKINYIKYKNYLLVSSNLEYIFTYKTLDQDLIFHKKAGYFKRGVKKNKLLNRAKQSKKLLKKFMGLIYLINKKYKNILIIIRPHPTENPDLWKNHIGNYKNIKVIDYGFLSDWIAKSKCLIHAGCTSGFEAVARDKISLSYNSKNFQHGQKVTDKISIRLKSENDAIKKISSIFRNKLRVNFNKSKKIIKKRIINISNTPAYESIIKNWEEIDNKNLSNKNTNSIKKLEFFLKDKIKKLIGKQYKNHKFTDISSKEIKDFKDRIILIKPKFKNIKFEIIRSDIVRIYRT